MNPLRQARGAAARLSGRRAEVWAAIWLMLKGYRILGFRLQTPQAEIDLSPLPNLQAWMKRIEALPGYGSPDSLLPQENRAAA